MHVCVDQHLRVMLLLPLLELAIATYVHGSLDFLVAIDAAVAKVADGAGVHSAFLFFELRNELHCAHLGRSAYRSCTYPVSHVSGCRRLDVPAGKIDRKASNRVLPGRSTPETSETRCWT
jgi:hypothetical protein